MERHAAWSRSKRIATKSAQRMKTSKYIGAPKSIKLLLNEKSNCHVDASTAICARWRSIHSTCERFFRLESYTSSRKPPESDKFRRDFSYSAIEAHESA